MRQLLRITGRLGLAFIVTLTLLELFLRFSASSTPSLVIDDPKFGVIFRPNTDFVYFTEGLYIGGVNEFGYLGPAYPPEKEDGVIRVALLGDSFIEGFQLFDRYHLRSVLEQELNGMGILKAEVMNFGFSGFNFEKMYYYYKEFVSQFHPDVVLFFIGQDDLEKGRAGLEPRLYVKEDSVHVDLSFAESAEYKNKVKRQFTRRLALHSMVKNAHRRVQKGKFKQIVLGKINAFWKPQKKKEDRTKKNGSDTRRHLNTAIFNELSALQLSGETRFAVVEKRSIDKVYRDYISSVGLPLYYTVPELERLRQSGISPNYWAASNTEGHWNHNAHSAIGRLLAPKISELTSHSGEPASRQ